MKIRDVLKERDSGVSFEFFPPKSAEGRSKFMKVVHDIERFDPLYVSVTYGAGGSTKDRTGNTLRWIQEETRLNVMSHLTCLGEKKSSIDDILQGLAARGIDNILALRGDPPRNVPDFDASTGEFGYAKDLVDFIVKKGDFSIAVAVYPEGHFESPSIEKDMEYTKQKIDAGADFAITQMFFDNRYFYEFTDRAEKTGINVPVFPGIMPVTDCRKIMEFANFCSATVPKSVRDAMEPFLDKPAEMRKLGVELAIRQCRDLIENGARYLHFYSMNRSDEVTAIIDALDGV
jgi:methylenetetrahydrofolate reductase (NADPH)